MKPQLLTTHIQILKSANPEGGWTELNWDNFDDNNIEATICCEDLDNWGLIEFDNGKTHLGTNHKLPVFGIPTNTFNIAITANGIRALKEHGE